MREDQGSAFFRGRAWFWDCVLFLKLIRKVIHKIYVHKKQDHLGNRNKKRTATGKTEATPVKLQDARRQNNVTTLIKMFEKHQHKEQFSLKTWVKSRRSQQLLVDMNHTEILQNINVLIAIPVRKSGSLIAVATEIWSVRRVLQHSRRPIATLLQSLALSYRRIPVEDQNMVLLKDRWCSSERNRCYTKQDKANTETIRRYFQGGTTKKSTESHWRSIKFAKKKLCFSIASLLKDSTIRLRELSGCRMPNIRFFVWMLMSPKSLFDSDQNLQLH